jgi:hypothetical protein
VEVITLSSESKVWFGCFNQVHSLLFVIARTVVLQIEDLNREEFQTVCVRVEG